MRKNVFPLYKTMVEIRQKHIFLRFFSEKHLLLTADWSHLCRSRSERRTANLTTTKIRQISLGKVGKIQLSWATPKSWKKGKKTQIHKTKRLQHWYSNKHFFPMGFGLFCFCFFGKVQAINPLRLQAAAVEHKTNWHQAVTSMYSNKQGLWRTLELPKNAISHGISRTHITKLV